MKTDIGQDKTDIEGYYKIITTLTPNTIPNVNTRTIMHPVYYQCSARRHSGDSDSGMWVEGLLLEDGSIKLREFHTNAHHCDGDRTIFGLFWFLQTGLCQFVDEAKSSATIILPFGPVTSR
jgi:hypothetical protein